MPNKPKRHVFVCTQQRPPAHPRGSCGAKGSVEVLQTFWAELQKRQSYEQVAITYSGCIGPCEHGANVLVYPEGTLYSGVTKADVEEIFTSHLEGDKPVERLIAPTEVWS